VAAVGSLYFMLYLYEWLCWTNKAKERRFKSQFAVLVEYRAWVSCARHVILTAVLDDYSLSWSDLR
jgi:hypothetical protein